MCEVIFEKLLSFLSTTMTHHAPGSLKCWFLDPNSLQLVFDLGFWILVLMTFHHNWSLVNLSWCCLCVLIQSMGYAYSITSLLLRKKLKNLVEKNKEKLLKYYNARWRGIGWLLASHVSSALPENRRTREAIQNTLVPYLVPQEGTGGNSAHKPLVTFS